MTPGHNPQVAQDASDELGAHTSMWRRRTRNTPIRTIGELHVLTKDMDVQSQVSSGHPPAAAGTADRLARKDF